MKSIAGYTDKISVRPGEVISFKVSCESGPPEYRAQLVRLICNDAHPLGPGFIERIVPSAIDGVHRGQIQPIQIGSWALVDRYPALENLASFSVQAMIWPTTPAKRCQTLVSTLSPDGSIGFSLELDGVAGLTLLLGGSPDKQACLATNVPLLAREWTLVAASYDSSTGKVEIHQRPRRHYPIVSESVSVTGESTEGVDPAGDGPLLFAAHRVGRNGGLPLVAGHYNGKIDSPRLSNQPLGVAEIEALHQSINEPSDLPQTVVGAWDFSRDIGSETITDLSVNHLHGRTINLPARGMKGWNWNGGWQDWRAAPQHYGAIHFHDDDLSDARWQTDFSLVIPDDLPSGIYAAQLENGADPEHIVFFVRPTKNNAISPICFLASTATYLAYGNYRVMNRSRLYEMYLGQLPELVQSDLFLNERPSYGDSLYASHNDGSGISIASRLRPLVNMRPNTTLSAFNDDGYLIAWLDAIGCQVDVITDEDLHNEGQSALEGHRVVITGNHPEYVSTPMWDALVGFLDDGGRLMYLGGNGFYWRIAYHPTTPGIIELRRAEDGARPWDAEPGEYYMSFNGEYGGMWRRTGRTPNELLGVGFTASGFDIGSYYRRMPESFDPRVDFIFKGIGAEELIGNFGIVGQGAAGQEIDRCDRLLGSPPHALVVARSENHTDEMMVAKEDMPATNYIIGGTENPLVRADMTFFETASGGAVFSVGSISWSASLPCNGFRNNVSVITRNVLERFVDPTPFSTSWKGTDKLRQST